MEINHYGFWIFKEGLFDLLDFFREKVNCPISFENDLIRYELHYTFDEQNIWFILLANDTMTIKAAKDSDDRDIVFFDIEYADEETNNIEKLKKYL
jgi:hypothetical protein